MKTDDIKALRAEYRAWMVEKGYSPNTAGTTSANVFYLWNKRGSETFWTAVQADEAGRREIIRETIEQYSPSRMYELSGFMTSFRYFLSFLDERGIEPSGIQAAPAQTEPAARTEEEAGLRFTSDMLEEMHRKVLADPGYGSDYRLIESVIRRFPENTDAELVAMKIALIDMTNSTNLSRHRQKINVRELADLIVAIPDFDIRLSQGDLSLVPIIARCNGQINLFSFASKYCTYHNVDAYARDDYAIFDSVVKENLPRYVPGLHEATLEKWRLTYDYKAYRRCIDDLLDANDIHIPFKRRKLDHFLWFTYRKAE